MRILVADDSEGIRGLMRRILTHAGFEVDLVENGDQLVTAWKEARHRVVFSDVEMPGKDGIAACREIRGMDPGVRLILMTGSLEAYERAAVCGLGPCLKKPFLVQQVIAQL
jgi:DNA-binding response OmpR family regulator